MFSSHIPVHYRPTTSHPAIWGSCAWLPNFQDWRLCTDSVFSHL